MNPITPQQFQDHAGEHRRDLSADFATEPARAARCGRLAGRPARLVAMAAVGAVAFFAGGLLGNDSATTTPPAAARSGPPAVQVADAAPDCVAPDAPRDRAPGQHPRFNRQRDRLVQIPV